MLVLIFSNTETFHILKRMEQDIIKNVHRSSHIVPLFLLDLYRILNVLDIISKYTPTQKFMKLHSVRAKSFNADGRTGRHEEANSRFSQFYERAYLSISGPTTAIAVFRNPNTIPFCLTTDLLLNVLFPWLLVHLPSTF
jgi:hypothetical protein